MVNCNLKKILYIPLALLVAVAVVMNVVPASVYAVEIESLPVEDEDLKISYDSDGVRIEDNGTFYEIPFNQDVRVEDVNGSKYHVLCQLDPAEYWIGDASRWVSTHTNSDVDGNAVPFSYWYSPSENRVYTFTGHGDYYKIDSYSQGIFHFAELPSSGHYLVVGYFDLFNDSYVPISVLGANEGKYRLESGYTLSQYNDTFRVNSTLTKNFPSDLICVYSSYEISGFYEPDGLSVFTPDYYFNYQYIYYKEDYGYVFIDSARPVKYIESIAGGTYANIVFSESCNKNIYTSTDGVNWSLESSVVDMYGIQYQLPHNWFYDSVGGSVAAVLIYTNDEGYSEEPLVTPEFGDIEDITGNLNNIILDGSPLPNGGREDGGSGSIPDFDVMTEIDYQAFVIYCLTHDYVIKWSIHYSDGTVESFYDCDGGRYGSFSTDERTISSSERVKVPTIAAYLYDVNMTLDDFVALYQLYSEAMHMDMKAIFDNITNTNTYLYDIKGLIQDMPDYTKSFDKLVNVGFTNNQLLEDINNNILALGSGSGEASPDDGSGSSSTTNSNITQDFLVTLDDEMLVVLNEIDSSIDFMSGVLVYENIDETFDELFDDEDDEEWLEVSNFINEALSIFTTNSVLSMAYTYAGSVSDGIGWLNARVDTFYNSSDIYKPVITLGAILFLVSVYLRKGGY